MSTYLPAGIYEVWKSNNLQALFLVEDSTSVLQWWVTVSPLSWGSLGTKSLLKKATGAPAGLSTDPQTFLEDGADLLPGSGRLYFKVTGSRHTSIPNSLLEALQDASGSRETDVGDMGILQGTTTGGIIVTVTHATDVRHEWWVFTPTLNPVSSTSNLQLEVRYIGEDADMVNVYDDITGNFTQSVDEVLDVLAYRATTVSGALNAG